MKKYIASSVALGLALSAVAAFAQEGATVSPSPRPVKTEIRAKVEAKKQEVKDKKADKNKERVSHFWNRMEKRLGVLIRNQNKLADRIAKRLDKASENGKDVAALKTQLEAARKLIKEAEDALKAGDAAVADIVAKNEPKEALKKVQQLNKDILTKIKAAHKALNEVIRAIKGLGGEKSPSPSPSPSASPTPTA